MLSFHFLGAPRLDNHNRPIATDTRKAIALAAYLALTHTAHERDELAAFFYPDADASHARAALRRTLSSLKTALGENILDIERETIALHLENVRVDVLEFRALAQKNNFDSLTRAAELYQGDFLAGFTLRDSPAFDEWQFFETESLRKIFSSVLEQLVAREMERGANKRAIESARRWLALDPLHEPAHRALMQLYARDGQRAAALRQYRECVRQLDQELGVAPLPETTELYRAIEENRLQTTDDRPQTAPEIVPSAVRRPPSSFPLVGRTRELETLLNAYAQISRSLARPELVEGSAVSGQLLILQGEAGIGKTRLAQEFLSIVAEKGATILSTRGYAEQRALAYAPFVQMIRAARDEPHIAARLVALPPPLLTETARLVPELTPNVSPPSLDGHGAQARFFDAVTQLLLTLTQNGSAGVLFFDDAQWLDDASLDLLAFLIRRLANAPLCILLTWRGEEIASDHLLRRLYADALRQERGHSLSLTRLAATDVLTLVNVAMKRGAPINAALAERLARESEGQPFFLIETLKFIERAGHVPDDDALPASVRELLHSRLSRASETARQLLSAAAVIGRSFDFEILDAVSGRSDVETIEGLEELAAQGLILETTLGSAPHYDFTHEKLRALVYEETSLARRRLLHRRAADALTQRARVNLDAIAGNIAQHYRAGGDDTRAAEFYKRAGDYARSVFANRDAVQNYTAALALGRDVSIASDSAQLHTAIGDAQTLLGEYDAALASYETSAAFGAHDADANRARVYLRRGEWERAARHLQNAFAVTKNAATQATLQADLALAQHHSHHDADALKHAQRALKLAQRAKNDHALAQANNILGILARTRGDWHTARKHLEASRALAEKRNAASAHAAALNNLALVYHAQNEDTRALEFAQRALELVTREGDRHRQAAMHNHLADLYHALGRDDDSMEQLKRAVAIYAEIGGGGDTSSRTLGELGNLREDASGESWQPEIWKLEEW